MILLYFCFVGLEVDVALESFGEHFFFYCVESGYDRLLRVLGGNLFDFLCNLDALHDHLGSIYPGMRAPSFRCTRSADGALVLHYYSDRPGLYPIVKGMLKTIAKDFFQTPVKVRIDAKPDDFCDHVIFNIREERPTDAGRERLGSWPRKQNRFKPSTSPEDLQISLETFCKAFPFHVVFDRNLQIKQAGVSLLRVIKGYRKEHEKLILLDVFKIVRPVMEFNFECVLNHINTIYVMSTRSGVLDVPDDHPVPEGKHSLRLKGQMVYVPERDHILYLCSPRVSHLEDLKTRGLFLSDIPVHDATRDLILITQARRAERELVEKLEETSNNLKKLQGRLQEDKRRTDELLHSILPAKIADRLRLNQPVDAEKHNMVSVLFSDIVGFTAMCGNENVFPMDIVRLLNRLYTQFDMLSNLHDVYKVSIVGQRYRNE